MADAGVVREFLVSLGFVVNEAEQRKFTEGVIQATKAVAELATGSIAAAGAVVAAIGGMASASEQLYFISQRTKASAASIAAFTYSISQLGGTVEGAKASLEGFANFLRSNPGAKGLLQSLGIDPNEDATKQLTDLGARLRSMPVYLSQRYAAMFGIDQNTLRALMANATGFMQQYTAMLRKAGVDSQAAAAGGRQFMVQLRTLTAAFDVLGQKVAVTLYGATGNYIKRFTDWTVAHFQQITDVLVVIVKDVLAVADGVVHLLARAGEAFTDLSSWFMGLNVNTRHLIASFGALLVAWRLLSKGFLANPIVALAAAFLLLFDDYETWRAGGKSLINWAQWAPEIASAIKAFKEIGTELNKIVLMIGGPDGWKYVLDGFAAWLALSWMARVLRVARTVQGALKLAGLLPGASSAAAAGGGAAAAGGAEAGAASLLGGIAAPLAALAIALWPTAAGSGEEAELQRRGLGLGQAAPLPADIEAEVRSAARAQGIDPNLAVAQFRQEGGGYSNHSLAGAFGPAQLMPDTARGLGVAASTDDPNYSWQTNADAGVRYMAQLLKQFHGNYIRALVAYNWGPGNAAKWDGKAADLPLETQRYLYRILSMAGAPAAATSAGGGLSPMVQGVINGLRHTAAAIQRQPAPRAGGYGPASGASIPYGAAMGAPTVPAIITHHGDITQTTNVTVHGAENPHKTAAAVRSSQTRVNAALIRNLRRNAT